MKNSASFCSRAVAYLKVAIFDDEPYVQLSREDSPVMRSLEGEFLAAYLVDEGEAFAYVLQRHLDIEKLDADALHRIAVANLKTIATEKLRVESYENIFAVFLEGNFEASLLLADDLWDIELAHLAPNGFVAVAPARDILAFCDIASDAGIAELRDLALRATGPDADHPLSPHLLKRQGRSWVRYMQ